MVSPQIISVGPIILTVGFSQNWIVPPGTANEHPVAGSVIVSDHTISSVTRMDGVVSPVDQRYVTPGIVSLTQVRDRSTVSPSQPFGSPQKKRTSGHGFTWQLIIAVQPLASVMVSI
jgi:hypothetical protein